MPVEEADPYLKILVYGRHGKGKTRLAATAPNVIIGRVREEGTRSAREFEGAQVFPINTWSDIDDFYWYLRQVDHGYQSVALDGLTAMQHMCMKYVLGELEDRDPTRETSMPDRRSWGKLSELMKEQILRYRNLPMHVIFTARERITGGEEDEEDIFHVPDLNPGTRGTALSAVEVIGRIYQKEVRTVKGKGSKKKEVKAWETRLLIGESDEFETKDQIHELGRIVKNPTIPMILEAAGLNGEE